MIPLTTHCRHFSCSSFGGIILAVLFLITIPGVTSGQCAITNLTHAEKAWLATHDHLRVQLAEDWPPYNYTEDGQPRGYVNDYLLLLADKLALTVDFVPGFNWSEYVDMLEARKIDCITNMTITPERRKRFLFSQRSVVDVFNGILTRKSDVNKADLEKLRGATLAVVGGYAQEELLELYYPDVNLLITENLLDSIRKVMGGKADAAIGAHAVFNHYIAKHLLDEVVSIPVTGNIIFPSAPHHLAVHKENTVLLGLLDKAASSLNRAELERLEKKWNLTRGAGYFNLSEEEQEYLARKENLNVCVDPDWMPMEAIRDGRHIGMAADYMQLLVSRLGTEMNLVPTSSWSQTLAFARERKCDIVSLAMSTPERRLYLHFSDPYFTAPLVIATKESEPFVADLVSLREKRIGVKKNYAFGPLLRERFPEITVVSIDTLEQGLRLVRDGSLYGFIGALPTLVYTIQQNFPTDLKIAGNTGEQLELRMGLRNDEPLLLSVMNKAIGSITVEERQEILNRWVAVQYEEGTDYQLVIRILAGTVILVVLLLYRQAVLNRFNRRLQRRNNEILEKTQLLQNAQQQLLLTKYAVDSCSFPIFWLHHDPDTGKSQVVHANWAAVASLGYTLDELTSIDPQVIADKLESPEAETVVEAEAKAKSVQSLPATAVFRRKDGSTFPVELHISSFTYEDKHYRFIFFNDITTQREMEAKLHRSMKMEAVGLMAGGVAHDLNNILSGIVAYPDLLLYQLEDDHPMRPQLQAIKNSGEQAAHIVDDLLTMARGVAAVRQVANLNTLTIAYFDSPEFRQLQQRFPRVRCSLHLAEDLQNVNCSPLHIKKSIMNLVTNGYEATPREGTVRLSTCNCRIDTESAESHYLPPADYVIFEVQDSGPGIPESAIPHIFEPFYTKKQMEWSGTGLGLSIVWNAAHDHDGTVIVENTRGGARFRLFLPATHEQVSEAKKTVVDEELYGNKEKILVIDDEPQQLDIARRLLQTLNYTPSAASSGEDAIARLRRESFDLVLLDMIMSPGMGGRETYAQIKEIQPAQKAIVVSGFSEDSEVSATLAMGAGKFVRKPYSFYTLAVAVRTTLEEN